MTDSQAADTKAHYMKLVVVNSNKPFKLWSILFFLDKRQTHLRKLLVELQTV